MLNPKECAVGVVVYDGRAAVSNASERKTLGEKAGPLGAANEMNCGQAFQVHHRSGSGCRHPVLIVVYGDDVVNTNRSKSKASRSMRGRPFE